MSTESAVLVQSSKVNLFYLVRQLTTNRGRARGLIAVWEEMRKEQNRLWVNTCPTAGHGRAETLALLTEMVSRNDRTPGCGQPQPM